MNSFGRLLAVSRRFYLWVFAIVVMVVLADCAFICKDKDVYLTKSGVTQMVQTTLAEENGTSMVENHYLTLENVATERGSELGLIVVVLGVMILLFAREIAFTDGRTQEFRHTWPIKNWVRELYDYVAMLLVIVLGFVLETLILLWMQIRHNDLVIDVLAEQGITSKVTDMMSDCNQYFLTSMVCCLLVIITSYTWISLGMSLAKNSIVGAILSVVVKVLVQLIWSCFAYDVIGYFTQDDKLNCLVSNIGDYLLYNQYFFWYLDENSADVVYLEYGFTVFHWMIAQIAICAVLIICFIISASQKDLSKGKMLYFPSLGYPLGVLIGFGVFAICVEWMWWVHELELILSCILSLSAAVGTVLLCRPVSKSKSIRLEVK